MTFDKSQFAEAIRLWTEWNDKINVVSRKDIENLFEHHILHSLAIAEYLSRKFSAGALPPGKSITTLGFVRGRGPLDTSPEGTQETVGGMERSGRFSGGSAPAEKLRILDLGCGGGFPGIPLAMVMPEAEFTLCDSIGKKVKVAQAVADGLGLKNVNCVNARAESLPGPYDWVVSRAVTTLENFYPWVKGKYTKGILYLKGGDVNQEISDLVRKCHVKPENISAWPISEWLDDDYFAEKFVIEIGKSYLCPPNSNN